MMFMSPRKMILAAAAATLLLGTKAFPAILATDVNAMAGFKGNTDFTAVLGTLSMKAEVDYAVYAPGQFNLTFGAGADPSNGLRYVYAYEIHNTGAVGNASERDPGFFSVGFDGNENPQNIGFVNIIAGDTSPSAAMFIPVASPPFASATWDFNPVIPDTKWSEILIFTSAAPPEFDDASVQGGGLTTMKRLPSPLPVPEPGTALAAVGIGAAFLMRRRASK
jgi:MYXO-CTERM domain-containing protein